MHNFHTFFFPLTGSNGCNIMKHYFKQMNCWAELYKCEHKMNRCVYHIFPVLGALPNVNLSNYSRVGNAIHILLGFGIYILRRLSV